MGTTNNPTYGEVYAQMSEEKKKLLEDAVRPCLAISQTFTQHESQVAQHFITKALTKG